MSLVLNLPLSSHLRFYKSNISKWIDNIYGRRHQWLLHRQCVSCVLKSNRHPFFLLSACKTLFYIYNGNKRQKDSLLQKNNGRQRNQSPPTIFFRPSEHSPGSTIQSRSSASPRAKPQLLWKWQPPCTLPENRTEPCHSSSQVPSGYSGH